MKIQQLLRSIMLVAVASLLTCMPGFAQAARPADPIDPTRIASLTLHDSTEGTIYAVAKVTDVDLTTANGQALAWQYALAPEKAAGHLGAAVTTAPVTAGMTTLKDLSVGAYLVHNNGVRGTDGVVRPSTAKAHDFVVTLPSLIPTDLTKLTYDVHVFPKPAPPTIEKTVKDSEATKAGGIATYTIRATIPGNLAGPYSITDRLDLPVPGTTKVAGDFLEFSAADWTGEVAMSLVGTGARTSLTLCQAGDDATCDFTVAQSPDTVSVTATAKGLVRLKEMSLLDVAACVEVTLHVRAKPSVDAATVVALDGSSASQQGFALVTSNAATLLFNDPQEKVTSDKVSTIRASLRIHKVDADVTSINLAGAEFGIYTSREDALARRNPIMVSGATNEQGFAQFPGLLVNDFRDNKLTTTSYWLAELKAPAGYLLATTPQEVRLLQDGTVVGADTTGALLIPNPKVPTVVEIITHPSILRNPDVLANTGVQIGLGLVAFTVLCLIGGVVVLVPARRRAR